MADSYFPLRWESTGDQWWYASPIDWAAANGHYDIVRELLHLDTNLLIKLTSLRRIRRLETVWDDDARFMDAARCRAFVARSLLSECETKNHENSLIRAGYGGWLLYSACSASDMAFVQELLERDPLLVFGEGEYGVTDMFYAAARGRNADLFRLLLDFAMSPRCSVSCGEGGKVMDGSGEASGASVFRWEMVCRAVHAAARGGSVEVLRELVDGCSDVSEYRDVRGSTVLHSASGRGQLEVVKYLMAFFGMTNSRDNQGNTALHVASFRGHLSVVEALISASPSSLSADNNAGDTFLHMAVAGFRSPGFRRLDRQMELMRHLIFERIDDIKQIVNLRNNEGCTVLHLAVVGNVHPDLVELLMTVPSINLNARDTEGMTPLALLKQQPRSPTSEILIKQLMSAGGVSSSRDFMARSAIASQIKLQSIASSPGTTFKISDAEIFLYTGLANTGSSARPSSCSSANKGELTRTGKHCENNGCSDKKLKSASHAAERIKILLRWPRRKEKALKTTKMEDADPLVSFEKLSGCVVETPTPLRQRFSKTTSLNNNKRTLAVRSSAPSSATKKKFNARLMQGVIEAMPHLTAGSQPPSGSFSGHSMTPPEPIKEIDIFEEDEAAGGASSSNSSLNRLGRVESSSRKYRCANVRLANFCFGAQGLTVEDSISGQQSNRMFKRPCLSTV